MKLFAKKAEVVAIGSISRDLMYYTAEGKNILDRRDKINQQWLAFPLAGKVDVPQIYLTWGGGAANTAVGLAKLGVRTAVIGCVGNDENGRQALTNLRAAKVAVEMVKITNQLSTGLSIIVNRSNADKEHVAFVYRGANDLLEFKQQKSFKGTKYFYLNSLNGDDWPRLLREIFLSARRDQVKIYWNPGARQLAAGLLKLRPYLKQTEVLQLNEAEARLLLAKQLKAQLLKQPRQLIKALADLGPRLVIITCGERGAYVGVAGRILHQPIYETKNVDTIGVGDSFGAAFLASLVHQPQNYTQALRWGLLNSGCNVAAVGAQEGILTRSEIEKLI